MTTKQLIAKYGTHKHGHALFAPSSAHAWMNCAGYLLANARAGDTAGVEAAYGTVAHGIAEEWRKRGTAPRDMLGKLVAAEAGGHTHVITVDEQMLAWIQKYIDWCDEIPGDHYYEQKVALSDIPLPIPNQSGTADHFACEPGKLTITDLKTGSVRVYAENNEQAQLYALGVFMEWDWLYDFQTIVIRICLPRLDVFDVWTIDRKQLLAFRERVAERANLAWQENAPRTPSAKACRYCGVRAVCPARVKSADDLLDATFGTYDDEDIVASVDGRSYSPAMVEPEKLVPLKGFETALANPEGFKKLSTTALSYVLTYRAEIERLFKNMADEAIRRAEAGEKLPFQSLKDGRRKWYWTDAEKAKAALIEYLSHNPKVDSPLEAVAPRRMLTPAKTKALIKRVAGVKGQQLDDMLDAIGLDFKVGERTLAGLSDDRPDVSDLIDDTFDTEDEEEL